MAEKSVNDLLPVWQDQYQKGREALTKKNYDYAVMIFCRILDEEPSFVECREALRITQFRMTEQSGGGGGFFKKAFGGMTHLSKAKMVMKKDPGAALSSCEQVLNKDPNNVNAHEIIAEAATNAGWNRTALLSLELLFNKLGKRDGDMAERLAEAYAATGQPGKAEEIYTQLVRENPGNLDLMQKLKDVSASRTMQEGGYEKAAETGNFRAALKDEAEAKRLEQESRLVQTSEASVNVVQDLENKVAAEPNSIRWWRALAEQYLRIKDYDKALSAYESLRQLMTASDPQLARTILEIKLRMVDKKMSTIDVNDPANAETVAALKKERGEIELGEMEALFDANPSDMVTLFDLGELYFKHGKIGKAIAAMQKTQNYPGKKIPSLRLLGQCFARRKMYDLAQRAYQNALAEKTQMDDEKKELIYLLGVLFEEMGDKEKAIEQFKLIYEGDIGYRDEAAHVDAYYGDE